MAVEPSEENILMVVEVTQADRETAKRYLRVKNNNAENAISALLDGEDITSVEAASRWDDSAWSTDREGGFSLGPNNTAFNDGNLHPLGSSAAPTRGSSPVPSLRRPQTKAEEDQEMEQALANSRHGALHSGQGTDIATTPNFHPATKSHYDPNTWAMTVPGASNIHEEREIVLDVDASERRNHDGHPRFLKHLPSGDYLPSLLTIAHAIPAARETMLARAHIQTSYGRDQDWWRGQAIRLPRIINADGDSPTDPSVILDEEIVNEMQRLMAFLDSSDRSYGCIDSLVGIALERARKEEATSETVMDQVLKGWESALCALKGKDNVAHSIFHSVVGTNQPNGNPRQDLWSLPLSVSADDRLRQQELTLADVMDSTIWDTDAEDESIYDTYMEHCADVLPMRVIQDGQSHNKLGLVIPPSFYVDRYLKENTATSRVVRKEMANTRKRIAQLEAVHTDISNIRNPHGSDNFSAVDMLQKTQGLLSGSVRNAVIVDYEARGIELPSGALEPSEPEKSKYEALASKLDNVWRSIEVKLDQLRTEKAKARELLSQLSQTNPPDLGGSNLKHKYTLRGVSTKPTVTYVLRPKPKSRQPSESSDLMDLTSDAAVPAQREQDDLMADPDAPPGWMWWRIEFVTTHSPGHIMKTESTQDDVLRAVELEHSSALLVYASDRAMEHPSDEDLPEPLAKFVAIDNKLFRHELDQEWSNNDGHIETFEARQGWSNSFSEGIGHSQSRRSSQGSTMVNYEEGDEGETGVIPGHEMDDAPPYSFDDAAHYSYPDDKSAYMRGQTWERPSPEAHEIHLEDSHDEGIEMTETGPRLLSETTNAANRQSVEMGEAFPAGARGK